MDTLFGSCLCGAVTFEVVNKFEHFQLCHCTQCQKTTGSAHAANLFTLPEYITWRSGQHLISRYNVPNRRISNAFCQQCGARTPFLSLSGEILAVPAGSLDGAPNITAQGNIFWSERALWYDQALHAPQYDTYIE